MVLINKVMFFSLVVAATGVRADTNAVANCGPDFRLMAKRMTAAWDEGPAFRLGSTERPSFAQFKESFRGVDDPETFYVEFQARRKKWNTEHPTDLDNMPTLEMWASLKDAERLLREEKRPRAVIQKFLAELRTLRKRGVPYRDTHEFFYNVSKFFSHRHPVANATRADEELMMYAKIVLSKESYSTFEQRFRRFHLGFTASKEGPQLHLDKTLGRFRRDLLNALEKSPSTDGIARIESIRNQTKARTLAVEKAKAKLAEIEANPRSEPAVSSGWQHQPRFEKENALSTLHDAEMAERILLFDGPERRRVFYTRTEDNRLPVDERRYLSHLADFKATSYQDRVFIAGAGLASIRGISEALLNGINPGLLIRRPEVIDGVPSNALATLSHDVSHVRSGLATPLSALANDEKRRILNGIDAIGNSDQRDLANYGLFLSLHENLPRPHDLSEWSRQAEELLGRPLSEKETTWLIRWMTEFHRKYDIKSLLNESAK